MMSIIHTMEQPSQCAHDLTYPYIRQLSGLVARIPAAALKAGVQTPGEEPKFFNIIFHQQKLSSLLIACDVRLEGALYSVFYAEASKRPWTSLN